MKNLSLIRLCSIMIIAGGLASNALGAASSKPLYVMDCSNESSAYQISVSMSALENSQMKVSIDVQEFWISPKKELRPLNDAPRATDDRLFKSETEARAFLTTDVLSTKLGHDVLVLSLDAMTLSVKKPINDEATLLTCSLK